MLDGSTSRTKLYVVVVATSFCGYIIGSGEQHFITTSYPVKHSILVLFEAVCQLRSFVMFALLCRVKYFWSGRLKNDLVGWPQIGYAM